MAAQRRTPDRRGVERSSRVQLSRGGPQLTDPDATPDEPAHHRRAQEAVEELARMGIDPVTLGLRPADICHTAPATGRHADAGDPPDSPRLGDLAVPGDPTNAALVPATPWAAGSTAPVSGPWPDQAVFAAPVPLTDPATPMSAPDVDQSPFRQPVRGSALPLAPDEPDDDPTQTPPTTPLVAPNGARHAVTAFGTGLFAARSAQRIQDEQHLLAGVRTPQREHQVVAFVAGKGGVGTTTTAAGVALTVAALRDDHTALVDAQAGAESLQRRLSDGVGSTPPGLADPDGEPGRSPVLRLSNGLDVLDGAPWQEPRAPEDLAAAIGDLLRDHTFTFVDLGDDVGATARQMLSASTRVVVVTAADRHAARATRLTLDRIHRVQPARLRDAVIAVVCLERWQYRRVLRELRDDLGPQTTQVVPIPYEPALATMDHLDLRRLRAASREAYLRVAAALAGPRPPTPVVSPNIAASPWAT